MQRKHLRKRELNDRFSSFVSKKMSKNFEQSVKDQQEQLEKSCAFSLPHNQTLFLLVIRLPNFPIHEMLQSELKLRGSRHNSLQLLDHIDSHP